MSNNETGWVSTITPISEGDVNKVGSSTYWTYKSNWNVENMTPKTISGAYSTKEGCMNEVGLPGLLPVELTSFTVEQTTGDELIFNWETASEIDNEYFVVEYSRDGVTWEQMDYVDGVGTTTVTHQYQYSHSAEELEGLLMYFRLRQIDYSGNSDVSDVIFCKVNKQGINTIQSTNILGQSIKQTHGLFITKDKRIIYLKK